MVTRKKSLINLSHFEACSEANGPGRRTVIWVQGCTIGCLGCINHHTWSQAPKDLVSVDELFAKIMANRERIKGVTFSGGEPFLQAEALAELSQKLKKENLSIVSFSGFTLEKLQGRTAPEGSKDFLRQIDLLIDGPYVQDKQTSNLSLRGSSNQKLRFLSDRYSEQDIKIPKIEFQVGQQTILTGFMNDSQGDLVLNLLKAVIT